MMTPKMLTIIPLLGLPTRGAAYRCKPAITSLEGAAYTPRLRASSHPCAIFFVGVLFALVFDTATQAAAWGYAATAQSGPAMAWTVGLAFTAGMMIPDTLDGRLMVRLLQRAGARDGALAYRRKVGWAVVVMSYGIAVHGIANHFYPSFELDDMKAGIAGGAMVVGLLATYAWFIVRFTRACSPTSE